MSEELQALRHLANGGAFDQVEATRLLARYVVGMVTEKQAPSATMDAPDQPDPEGGAPKRKKVAPEATA